MGLHGDQAGSVCWGAVAVPQGALETRDGLGVLGPWDPQYWGHACAG